MSIPDSVSQLGVLGAGSMGAGISQLGCLGGLQTLLVDIDERALERARERIAESLRRSVERGRIAQQDAERAMARLTLSTDFSRLSQAELVIEAVPESLELKRATFERLSALPGERVLATNTSSLMIAAIASAAQRPQQVVGMHFFNPPERMRLVELVAGPECSPQALKLAREVALAMGREPIEVLDRPGFLVNRCLRPFYSEALKLLEEGVAGHEQIDRIMRVGGGFRMGAFELLDLVGMDVNLEVTRSFYAQSSGEPRWKPSVTQVQMVAAGRFGRKTGQGFYDYRDGPHRAPDPEPPAAGGADGRVAILGEGAAAKLLRDRAKAAGFEVSDGDQSAAADLVLDAGLRGSGEIDGDAPRVLLLAASSLAARGDPSAVGFHLLPEPGCRLVELTALPTTPQASIEAADELFGAIGFHREWVGDAPGLVLGRIVCQTINEACFAIGEGIASPEDVDTGVTLGLNHPVGPVQRAKDIGSQHVLAILAGLWTERQEERYRLAPLLRYAAATGEPLRRPPTRTPLLATSPLGGSP